MAQQVLIGSRNPSKIRSLSALLEALPNITPLSPIDLGVEAEVEETGVTMADNARLKAEAFHRLTGLPVLSADSGLYFREFPMDDPRQPGSHIRRVNGKTLTDDEMIAYYSRLAEPFGVLHACYCNAYAVVDLNGNSSVFFQDDPGNPDFFEAFGFLLCSIPHAHRNPGWPLDSLSKHPHTGQYWFDMQDVENALPSSARNNRLIFQENLNRFLREHFQY